MKKAILLLPAWSRDRIYPPEAITEIKGLVDLTDCSDHAADLEALRPVLSETEIIVTGWGMMTLDEEFLSAAPMLEAVFYGAGSVRHLVTDSLWQRDILLTSAWASNGIPVIEFTLAALILGLKEAIPAAQATRAASTFKTPHHVQGMYGARIGIVGVGTIGAGVLTKLKDYDVETFCYDPYLSEKRAAELGATPMGLDEIFRTCDAVTLHAANIAATEHMITGRHFRSMKDGAVFVNTARGRIIKEDEMVDELERGRIFAFIDVTDPEPPPEGSPLYALPNVLLTPHVAGPRGNEVHRNAQYVLEELRRFLAGEKPRYPITEDMMEWLA